MLDTSKLADKILDDLYSGGLYTDMSRGKLKESIEYYILLEYSERLEKLNKKINFSVISGDRKYNDYDDDFEKIKNELLIIVEELSRTGKEKNKTKLPYKF